MPAFTTIPALLTRGSPQKNTICSRRPILCSSDLSRRREHNENQQEKYILKPTPSRYEAFYSKTEKDRDDNITDVNALSENENGDDNGAETTTPTVPFFVGYAEEELMALWEIHRDTVGERKAFNHGGDKELGSGEKKGNMLGGLHELIVEATSDGQQENGQQEESDGRTE